MKQKVVFQEAFSLDKWNFWASSIPWGSGHTGGWELSGSCGSRPRACRSKPLSNALSGPGGCPQLTGPRKQLSPGGLLRGGWRPHTPGGGLRGMVGGGSLGGEVGREERPCRSHVHPNHRLQDLPGAGEEITEVDVERLSGVESSR